MKVEGKAKSGDGAGAQPPSASISSLPSPTMRPPPPTIFNNWSKAGFSCLAL